ncbi:hypothetical protein N0V82_000801 [Gnomoniopsis sp. IMI 355080]|nr:hypothetical protein N0V82_000801 [Gnomoniopsis sp. IMI 355080]
MVVSTSNKSQSDDSSIRHVEAINRRAEVLPHQEDVKQSTTKTRDEDTQGSNAPSACSNLIDNILNSSRIVIFLVGSNKVRSSVHDGVFKHPYAGSFLKMAFTKSVRDASDGVLELPEDDPWVFDIFVKWLYSVSLDPNSVEISHLRLASLLSGAQTRMMARIKVYTFAQKYLCYDLQDMIISETWKWITTDGRHIVATELSDAKL